MMCDTMEDLVCVGFELSHVVAILCDSVLVIGCPFPPSTLFSLQWDSEVPEMCLCQSRVPCSHCLPGEVTTPCHVVLRHLYQAVFRPPC